MEKLAPLGLFGSLLGSTGGSGWGPVTTSILFSAEADRPRKIIGTVFAAGLLVSLAVILGLLPEPREEFTQHAAPVIGLSCGGAIAVPLAAYLVGRISPRPPGVAIGDMLVGLDTRTLFSPLVSGGVLAVVPLVQTFAVIALVLWMCSCDILPGLRQRVQFKSISQFSSADVSSPGSPSPASADAGAEDASEGMKVGAKNGVHIGEVGISWASECAPVYTGQTDRSNVACNATWTKRPIKTRN